MARMSRLYAADFAQLVAIHFRQAPTTAPPSVLDRSYLDLMTWLGDAVTREGVKMHGWSLTPRAMHFLMTPRDEKSIPSLVQSLGRNLAADLKVGSVFSGRYHAMIPQPALWVLPVLTWLEYLPVQEGLTDDSLAWPWSSARAHTGVVGAQPKWFQPHPDYWQCGNTPFDRQANYRQLLFEGLPKRINDQIEACLRGQWAMGEAPFLETLEKITGRRVSPAARGRPRKAPV